MAQKPQHDLSAPLLVAHTQQGLLGLSPDDTALLRHSASGVDQYGGDGSLTCAWLSAAPRDPMACIPNT
eukprot:5285093-Prorocentrum_lima.AAC.1